MLHSMALFRIRLLRELSIPYAILLDDGKAVWMNDEFEAILGGKAKRRSLHQ